MKLNLIGIYSYEKKVTAPDTSNVECVGTEVKQGTLVVLDLGSIVDYTTANKKLILGKRDAEKKDHYLIVRKNAQYYQAHLEGKMTLHPGERPIGIVESPTTSDVVYCTFDGFIYKVE